MSISRPDLTPLAILLGLSLVPGCWAGVSATVGPKVGYAFGRGVTYGWSVRAGAYADEAAFLGTGVALQAGQTWLPPSRVPAILRADDMPENTSPAAWIRERVTFLEGGLNWTAQSPVVASPVFETGLALGPAWSTATDWAGLAFDMSSLLAAVPYVNSSGAGCNGGKSRSAATFLITVDVQHAFNTWELSVSPQAGIGYATYQGSPCLE